MWYARRCPPLLLANILKSAAAKGLIAGRFFIQRPDGSSSDGLGNADGLLIPKLHDDDQLILDDVDAILVIEKEAVFRSLISSPLWISLKEKVVALTAKGYPDLASREFLCALAERSQDIPVYSLVDFDPDGIGIMSTYKYGSLRLAHESLTDQGTSKLDLPNLRWLGIRSEQILQLVQEDTANGIRGLLRMSARDRNKASRMLEWDICAENGPEVEWRRQLQEMLVLNIKAEMQILEERPGGLARWISDALQ
jgi:meiotic recombination protein SPO11